MSYTVLGAPRLFFTLLLGPGYSLLGTTKDKGKGGIGNVIEIVWDHVTFFNVRRVMPREEVSNEPLLLSTFMASYLSYSVQAQPMPAGFYLGIDLLLAFPGVLNSL